VLVVAFYTGPLADGAAVNSGQNAPVEASGKEEAGERNAQVGTSGKEEAGDAAGDRQWMSLGEILCDGTTVTLELKGRSLHPATLVLKDCNMNPVVVRQTKYTAAVCVVPEAAWPPRVLSAKTEDIPGMSGSLIAPPLQCLASCGLLNGNNSLDSLVQKWARYVGKEAHGARASPVECLTVRACPPSVRSMLSSLAEEGGSTLKRMVACARAWCLQLFANSPTNRVALVTLCTGKRISMNRDLLEGRWELECGSPVEAVVVLVEGSNRVQGGGAGFNLSSLKPTWGEGAMKLSGVARCELGGAMVSQCLIHGRWWEFREGRVRTVKSAKTADGVVFVYTREEVV
jgi:hypothetical protein